MLIELASTPVQYMEAKKIFEAYAQFLGFDLELQGFSKELKTLAEMYSLPKRCLLVAKEKGL